MIAPAFTLRLMRLHAPADALPYLSFIGAFVFSVGLACLYGALRRCSREAARAGWRSSGCSPPSPAPAWPSLSSRRFWTHTLEAGWLTVAVTDGACVLIQAIGLRKGWLAHVAR